MEDVLLAGLDQFFVALRSDQRIILQCLRMVGVLNPFVILRNKIHHLIDGNLQFSTLCFCVRTTTLGYVTASAVMQSRGSSHVKSTS